MENFYYDALYDLLHHQNNHPIKGASLRMMKAKIIRLHSTQESAMFLDIGEKDRYSDETPSSTS
jgi:hypothetical protein